MDYHKKLIKDVKKYPISFIFSYDLECLFAFLTGCDAESNWAMLRGYREWLVAKHKLPTNLHWTACVRIVLMNYHNIHADYHLSEESAKKAVDITLDSLLDFYDAAESRHGLLKIYFDYHKYLSAQDWYDESSPDWVG